MPHRGGVSHTDSSSLVPINDIFFLQSMRPPVLHQIKCENMHSQIFLRLVTEGGAFTHAPPSSYAPDYDSEILRNFITLKLKFRHWVQKESMRTMEISVSYTVITH